MASGNPAAAFSSVINQIGNMKSMRKGLELAKVAQQYAQQQGLPGLGGANNNNFGGSGFGQASKSSFGGPAKGLGVAGASGLGALSALAGAALGHGNQNDNNRSSAFGQNSGFGQSAGFGQQQQQAPFGQQQQAPFGQQQAPFGQPQQAPFGQQQQAPFGQPQQMNMNAQQIPQAVPFSGSMAQPPNPYGVQQQGGWQQWGQPAYGQGVYGSSNGYGQAVYGGNTGYGYGNSANQAMQGGYGGYSAYGAPQTQTGYSQSGYGGMLGAAGLGMAAGGLAGYGYNQGAYGPPPPPSLPENTKGGKGGGSGGGGGGGGNGGGGGGSGKGGKKGKGGAVVTNQPVSIVPDGTTRAWLSMPTGYDVPEGIPKGLEILAMVDGLMVHQEIETLEAIANAIGIGYEGNNQYKISDRAGVHVYQAVEDTGFCWRCCCTQLRPVHMKVYDQRGNQVLSFQRHFRCFPCAWFECCRENVTVFHGPKDDNNVIGRVTQSCCGGCCTPKLNVLSKKGERELLVKGPCVLGDCCGVRFDVLTDKKKKVGEVKKLAPSSMTDVLKEIATDADKFTITFPKDLKVETKATALVALLVIDLLFFEYGGNTNRNMDGSCTIDLCVMFCCGCPIPCRVTVNGLGATGDKAGILGAPEAAQMDR